MILQAKTLQAVYCGEPDLGVIERENFPRHGTHVAMYAIICPVLVWLGHVSQPFAPPRLCGHVSEGIIRAVSQDIGFWHVEHGDTGAEPAENAADLDGLDG